MFQDQTETSYAIKLQQQWLRLEGQVVRATLDGLYHYLSYAEMIVATSRYWNVIHGRLPDEVSQDAEGVQIMHILGKNMAWLLKMKEATSGTIQPPISEERVMTNFIR